MELESPHVWYLVLSGLIIISVMEYNSGGSYRPYVPHVLSSDIVTRASLACSFAIEVLFFWIETLPVAFTHLFSASQHQIPRAGNHDGIVPAAGMAHFNYALWAWGNKQGLFGNLLYSL